ncbi:MAG: PH domain-containing protein [Pseudomonadota bacterium]
MGKHERLIVRASFPWIQRAFSWVILLGMGAAPIIALFFANWAGVANASLATLAILSSLAAALIFFVMRLYMQTTEFGLTDHRVVFKKGVISRHTNEIPLESVETVHLTQTIIGRLLGFGCLDVAGSGGTQLISPPMQNPLRFRTAVDEARTDLMIYEHGERPRPQDRSHRSEE